MIKPKLFEGQVARKPDHHPWAREMIDVCWKGDWKPNEFLFKADYNQFKKDMDRDTQGVFVRAITTIGQVEIAVKTHWARLGDHFSHPSLADLGYVLSHQEVIHNLAYEKVLTELRLEKAFEENLQTPELSGRVEYLRKHLEKPFADDYKKSYIYTTILFTLFIENVSLFSQFYIILALNRFSEIPQFMPDTAQQVEYTRNEETIHANVGIKLINILREEYPELFDKELEDKVIYECHEAFIAESRVIRWILQGWEMDHVSQHILENFIKYRFNTSLRAIGYKEIFEIDEAAFSEFYWFEEELLANNMTDFFVKRDKGYGKKAVTVEMIFED